MICCKAGYEKEKQNYFFATPGDCQNVGACQFCSRHGVPTRSAEIRRCVLYIAHFVHFLLPFEKIERKCNYNLLHNNDTFFGCSIAVNVINTSACTTNNLQIRRFNHFGCHFCCRAHNQAIIFLQCKYIFIRNVQYKNGNNEIKMEDEETSRSHQSIAVRKKKPPTTIILRSSYLLSLAVEDPGFPREAPNLLFDQFSSKAA